MSLTLTQPRTPRRHVTLTQPSTTCRHVTYFDTTTFHVWTCHLIDPGTWLCQSKWHVYPWCVVMSKWVPCLHVVRGCVKVSGMSTRSTWLCQVSDMSTRGTWLCTTYHVYTWHLLWHNHVLRVEMSLTLTQPSTTCIYFTYFDTSTYHV
jgi:hypothetical protein